jgi:hypothetical protein
MLSKGLEIELYDFEAEYATLKGDYMRQGVPSVMGGVPTILDIRLVCFFMCLARTLFQGTVSTNLFNPV